MKRKITWVEDSASVAKLSAGFSLFFFTYPGTIIALQMKKCRIARHNLTNICSQTLLSFCGVFAGGGIVSLLDYTLFVHDFHRFLVLSYLQYYPYGRHAATSVLQFQCIQPISRRKDSGCLTYARQSLSYMLADNSAVHLPAADKQNTRNHNQTSTNHIEYLSAHAAGGRKHGT